MIETPYIALLGYGEAGSAFGRDLLHKGARVRAYDPKVHPDPGIEVARSEAEAVAEVDLVLSVNCASAAAQALHDGAPAAKPGAVWADMNTASPQLKQQLCRSATAAGMRFADVAIMSPVPGKGLLAPMLVSGPGADYVAGCLGSLGTPITVQPGGAGAAAERKLLRSVFFKGLAAAVVEALEAARAAGCEDWLRESIATELVQANVQTLDRLVDGTHMHAERRADEMAASAEMLVHLGVPPVIATASRNLLRRILREDIPRSRHRPST